MTMKIRGFAERLMHYRQEAGLERAADLARAVGVTRAAVSQWETGKSTPTLGTLHRIAGVLGISPRMLLDPDVPESEGRGE